MSDLALDALKIVCLHYDTKTIDKSISNNKKYEIFNEKVITMCIKELINIYNVSIRFNFNTSMIYTKRDEEFKDWSDVEWKFVVDLRNKHKTILEELHYASKEKKLNFKYFIKGIKFMHGLYNLCDEEYVKKKCIKNDFKFSRQNFKTIQEVLIDNEFQKILDLDFS